MRLKILLAVAFLLGVPTLGAGLAYLFRTGDEIKVYSSGQRITPVIQEANRQLALQRIQFRLVPQESAADLTVEFKDRLPSQDWEAHSFPYRGYIEIGNDATANCLVPIFVHEALHCAGLGHDPVGSASVMAANSHPTATVSPSQMRDLRRLSGITTPERLIAQVRCYF